LSRFARRHVKVALSGDGGDELYGGYPRYFWAARIQRWRTQLGSSGARFASGALRCVPDWIWDGAVNRLSRGRYAGAQGLAERVSRFARYLSTDLSQVDSEMIAAWPNPDEVMLSGSGSKRDRYSGWTTLDWADQMMAVDQESYLPDDILTKVDRASMAVSMEVRVPMLDHRLVEWSWRVPRAFKFSESGDRGKLLLREVLYRHVPKELIERPKMGFGMPMDRWLRGPLKTWADDVLSDSSLREVDLLKPKVVIDVWKKHLGGQNRLPQLWTVLMLQLWVKRWRQASTKGH
jgi:asparagine synthase (glutamine-hydrolysing)